MQKKCDAAAPLRPLHGDLLTDVSQVQFDVHSSKLNLVVTLTDDAIGQRGDGIGQRLLLQIVRGLASKEPFPNALLFLNRAVYLTTENSPLLNVLRDLEAKGVIILSNSSCLAHYQLMEKLAVGGLTNSYHVAELLKLAKRTITL